MHSTDVVSIPPRISLDKSQLLKLQSISLSEETAIELSSEEKSSLSSLLNEKLETGHLLEATKVSSHFGHPNQDLNIILVSLCV